MGDGKGRAVPSAASNEKPRQGGFRLGPFSPLRAREIAPRRASAGAFSSKSIVSGESAKSEVAAEGGKEGTGLRAETTRKSATDRDPSKRETAGRTAAIVRGTLLLIPVKEEDSPHRVPNI
jgi:hypothetical protein